MSPTQSETGNGRGHHEERPHVGESAERLWMDARTTVNDLNDRLDLRGRVERNPYAMVAAAVGVGYLLGGGLFTALTGRLVSVGIRLAAIPLVKDELMAIAGSAFDDFTTPTRYTKE